MGHFIIGAMKNLNILLAIVIVSLFSAFMYWMKRFSHKNVQIGCYLEVEDKPQSNFKRILVDNSYRPFKHLKRDDQSKEGSTFHPYEEEITFLLEHPFISPAGLACNSNFSRHGSHVWISTVSQLKEVVNVLSKEFVFAVDTEQHSLRSFLGFTALMQISTKEEDYLVDTIALHDEMHILRSVFADSSICKVFHGADNDVLWLQRDFHIYVVNIFDTAKACSLLQKPQKSLAYLLETYCGVVANKALQLEDWRVRPLTSEMVDYALSDVHYLLYIADRLLIELKAPATENMKCSGNEFGFEREVSHPDELGFVREVSRRSNSICLQLYAKDTEALCAYSTAVSILSRNDDISKGETTSCTPEIIEIVRKICSWRDLMARVHDESPRYVLSDRALVALALKAQKVPEEICAIIREADAGLESPYFAFQQSPSPVVYSHVKDFEYLLDEAKDDFLDVLKKILQEHLGRGGKCPFSAYNYALLSKYSFPLQNNSVEQNGRKLSKQIGKKASRALFVQKFSCKSPVYDNCRIYADDHRLLCYCDRRKLEWYLNRKLAKLVDEEPPAIVLLFEPKGRPEDEDNDFYIQSKRNICVGCGEERHYLRYRIIPSCYRMHFPEHLKSHRSHDIVLLCVDCHEIAHTAAEKYKRLVAKEFGISLFLRRVANNGRKEALPDNVHGESSGGTGVSPLQLRTAAMALLRHGSRMPPIRQEELREVIRIYFGSRVISNEDLERALLVTMTPHERRRLVKKRGLSFKTSVEDIISVECRERDINCGTHCSPQNRSFREESSTRCDIMEHAVSTCLRDASVDDYDIKTAKSMEANQAVMLSSDSAIIQNVLLEESSSMAAQLNSGSKLSLLGHGPHGKQVVDRILEEGGEEGISQFCQNWRQVFVEAIHPRFLPTGWDIKHSGRRDFGEYSVYNPAKKSASSNRP